MEQRTIQLENVELRAAEGDKPRRLIGYAATFGEAVNLGEFHEVILPGAFKRALEENDVRALVEHDRRALLGRTSAGTLRLKEDDRGLRVEIDVPNTTAGNDLAELVTRGDISGMSFGFRPYEGGEQWHVRNGDVIRELSAIDMKEITATSVPAYTDTELALRSIDPEAIEKAKSMNEPTRLKEARRQYRQAQAAI